MVRSVRNKVCRSQRVKSRLIKSSIDTETEFCLLQKLDSFLDSNIKTLTALDEANKVKNAAYGIDAKHSATSQFINELIAAKVKSASGSIGPVLNSAQTFLSSAKQGLTGAVVSKFASLSSLSQGLSSPSASKPDQHHAYGAGKTTKKRASAFVIAGSLSIGDFRTI